MRISDWSSDVCSSDLLVEIGIGHDDAMVLRAAHRLDALSVRDAAVIDIMRDVRRADEADRADVGMVEDRVDHFLVAVDGLEYPLGHPGFEAEFGQAQDRESVV